MYIVIDLNGGQVRKFGNLTEQQIQALTDCEEYCIIRIHAEVKIAADDPHPATGTITIWSFDENTCEQEIKDGIIAQDGSIVEVR